jgi:starvation-inducible DNA-binding protein
MATTATAAYLVPLGRHERDEIGHQLQATLVELVDLSLIGKQLHWTVVGPQFRSLHLQLDEIVDDLRESADLVAERAVALGFMPDGQAAALVATELAPIERGAIPDRDVIRQLAQRLAEVDERIRGRVDRVGALDPVSQDVLVEALRELEKHLWMIRSQEA